MKTSVGATNRPVAPKFVRKLVHEANRRIGILQDREVRLGESRCGKERVIGRHQGIISFHNSKISPKKLLDSAARKGWFGKDETLAAGFARSVEPRLYGMNKEKQIQEIRIFVRLRESTAAIAEDSAVRMKECVAGEALANCLDKVALPLEHVLSAILKHPNTTRLNISAARRAVRKFRNGGHGKPLSPSK